MEGEVKRNQKWMWKWSYSEWQMFNKDRWWLHPDVLAGKRFTLDCVISLWVLMAQRLNWIESNWMDEWKRSCFSIHVNLTAFAVTVETLGAMNRPWHMSAVVLKAWWVVCQGNCWHGMEGEKIEKENTHMLMIRWVSISGQVSWM